MKKKHKPLMRKLINFFARPDKEILLNILYRVISIEETEEGLFEATIQLIGKGVAYKIQPEEILADDKFTNQFSPCDIRTLTYLGYLSMNSPKYRILAQRLTKDERILFMVHKKGSKQIEMKTAEDLSKNAEILDSLNAKDAHKIGYASASENFSMEKKQLEQLGYKRSSITTTSDKNI